MTLSDKTKRSQTDTVELELDLEHAPAKVWRALTDPALLAEWLLPVVGLELAPGTEFRFEAPPQPGWDGIVNCRILEIEVEKKLRLAWVVGDLDTIVTFTIAAMASGTRLSIVQSGFRPDQKRNFGGALYGWKQMSGRLEALLGRMA